MIRFVAKFQDEESVLLYIFTLMVSRQRRTTCLQTASQLFPYLLGNSDDGQEAVIVNFDQ